MSNEMSRLFLGDGGTVSKEAEDEYALSEKKAQAAYCAAMEGAPPKKGLMSRPTPDRQMFLDRADAAYSAIEGPARIKRDAQWIPGPRPVDYSIGLGESEVLAKDWPQS